MTTRGSAVDLSEVLARAASGRFPPVDGGWERLARWRQGVFGILAFTGHAFVCAPASVSDTEITALGVAGYGEAHQPDVVTALAAGHTVHTLDAVLARHGTGSAPGVTRDPGAVDDGDLARRDDLAEHPRVRLARSIRDDVQVWGVPPEEGDDLLTLARGLGGLPEFGIETTTPGAGAALLARGLDLVPADQPVIACCAPGNARALRRFLHAGFRPVASVQLWHEAGA